MLKTVVISRENGREVIIIGLNREELSQLQRPGKAVLIKGDTFGASADVVIFHGENEAEMLEALGPLVTLDTNIIVDDKLKN